MTTKVTICIPAYNSGPTIAETLDSLMEQSFQDFEIIVSDNHSTDNTRDVVKSYEKHGVRMVTCALQPVKTGSPLDNTLSAIQNWNSLLELGQGDFIGIYHADDLYKKDIIRKQAEFLENNPGCSAVFPDCTSFETNDGKPALNSATGETHSGNITIFSQPELVKAMLRRGHFMSSSGPMIRRTSWKKAGRINAEQFEQACDSEFWIRLSGTGPVGIMHEQLVLRRIHQGQDSHHGLELYRYRPLPIIKVLDHAIQLNSVKDKLNDDDYLHVKASVVDEDFRVALNLMNDDRLKEAKSILKMMPSLNVTLARLFWEEHRKLPLARMFLGKFLLASARVGLGKPIAGWISRSKYGFPRWLRK